MATIAILSGPVSAVRVSQDLAVTTMPTPTGSASSPTAVHNSMTLRIGNRPVSMDGFVSLVDGDLVTAAVVDGNNFQVIALRNDTTRTVHQIPQPKAVLAFVFIALGVMTLWLMLIGVLFILVGVGYWIKAQSKKRLITDALAALAAA
jgi:hypothetical protein